MILRRKEGEGRRFGGEYSCHMVECEGCRHMAEIWRAYGGNLWAYGGGWSAYGGGSRAYGMRAKIGEYQDKKKEW